MKQNMTAKIFAFIALFGIIIGIIGTGILFLFESNTAPQEINLTEEQIQELIEAQGITLSGSVDDDTSIGDILEGTETTEAVETETVGEDLEGENIEAEIIE